MVGALLVTVAVVGVVAAHLAATATPDTRFLAVLEDVPAGTLLGDAAAVEERFEAVPLDLPPAVADAVVSLDDVEGLVGQRVVVDLRAGDLLLSSALGPEDVGPGSSTLTFALPPEAAVGAQLSAGDLIDVVATVGSGETATTAYVVRAAPLLEIVASAGAGGLGGEQVRLTVSLEDQQEVQALAHALATGTVVVVRSPDDGADVPGRYRFGDAGSSPGDGSPDTPTPGAEGEDGAPDEQDAAEDEAGEPEEDDA